MAQDVYGSSSRTRLQREIRRRNPRHLQRLRGAALRRSRSARGRVEGHKEASQRLGALPKLNLRRPKPIDCLLGLIFKVVDKSLQALSFPWLSRSVQAVLSKTSGSRTTAKNGPIGIGFECRTQLAVGDGSRPGLGGFALVLSSKEPTRKLLNFELEPPTRAWWSGMKQQEWKSSIGYMLLRSTCMRMCVLSETKDLLKT